MTNAIVLPTMSQLCKRSHLIQNSMEIFSHLLPDVPKWMNIYNIISNNHTNLTTRSAIESSIITRTIIREWMEMLRTTLPSTVTWTPWTHWSLMKIVTFYIQSSFIRTTTSEMNMSLRITAISRKSNMSSSHPWTTIPTTLWVLQINSQTIQISIDLSNFNITKLSNKVSVTWILSIKYQLVQNAMIKAQRKKCLMKTT